MIKRRKKPPLVDVEVGSFSDIAFLLIIFFILTTQIARFTGHLVTIPSGAPSEGEKKEEEKQITVNIASDGSLTYSTGENSNVPLTLEELKVKMLEENFPAKEPEKRLVIVDSKADVPYELYYKVVMIISDCGGVLALIDYGGDSGGEDGTNDSGQQEGS